MNEQDSRGSGQYAVGSMQWAVRGLQLAAACLWLGTLPVVGQVVTDEPVRRCANELVEQRLQRQFPKRKQQLDELNEQVRAFGMLDRRARGGAEVIYRIPVVVHVIHNTASGATGGRTNPNISDDQINSQIRVLNEDYRKKTGTPGGSSTNPIAVDTGIEFFLATTDPDGRPTNGITRTYTPTPNFAIGSAQFELANLNTWPTDRYLNIWVCANSDSDYLGFAQFPTVAPTSLPGLTDVTDTRIDGVVIDHRYFGVRGGNNTVVSALYNGGRTVTHEIGHWLGLFHVDGDTFCGTDFVADTPPAESLNNTNNLDCSRQVFSNCNNTRTRNLTENYMDYTPDPCMNLFTVGQRDRMRAVLELSPRRRQVVQSALALPETPQLTLTVYPNPVSTSLESTVDVQFTGSQAFETALYDMSGRLLQTRSYSASLSRSVSLSVSGLPTGIYVLRVTTPTETASKRILVK
jgi:hypothetical protein